MTKDAIQEAIQIDVSQEPQLRALAHEVRRSRRPHVLRDEAGDLAMVVPVEPAAATVPPTTPAELAELFRATYTLKQPLTWDEIKMIAEEDAADEAVRRW